jgi:ligand-binding sensor domain-containing protein/serine phosphatase RsbU (regulator of sigma subunit)
LKIQNLILLASVSLWLSIHSFGQAYTFNYLNKSDGLTSNFINDVVQSHNGYLYICTSDGLAIFNGESVEIKTVKDHLINNFISCALADDNGNIWLGHNQGGGSIIQEGKIGTVHTGEGVDSQINDIAQGPDGKVWYVAQDFGLYFCDEQFNRGVFSDISSDKLYYSLHVSNDNELFVGTNDGIELFKFSSDNGENNLSKIQNIGTKSDDPIKEILNFDSGLISVSLNGVVNKLTKIDGSWQKTIIPFTNLLEDVLITDAYVRDEILYISTLQQGVLKCKIENGKWLIKERFNLNSGLKTSAVNSTFMDREGVLWISTFGEGLASKDDDIFTNYFKDPKVDNSVSTICVNKTDLFIGSTGRVLHYDKVSVQLLESYDYTNGIPKDEITSLIFDSDSNMYFGTSLHGVYQKLKNSNQFTPIFLSDDYLASTINTLTIKDDNLLIGTINGMYRYNVVTGGISVFNITVGLPHNSINYVKVAADGVIYVATNSAFISQIKEGYIHNIPVKDGYDVVDINMISENKNGEIWFSSNGNGIFKLLDTTCINISKVDGLASDYCNSVTFDINNNVWVTFNEGLCKINLQDSSFKNYGSNYGVVDRFLRSSVGVFENESWYGTENGVLLYDAQKDLKNSVPPITRIKEITINAVRYAFAEDFELEYGSYDFVFDIAGLSLKDAGNVKYEFLLEGVDSEWSRRTSKSEIYYTRIADGNYVFKVKSFNADGTEGSLVSVNIHIASPFWKKWWFYACIVGAIIFLFVVVLRSREGRLRRYQKKLESELKSRTKEVVEQKNQIEEINKDITDSINYAQRIQNSILPTDESFLKIFPKSFIFFQPRDIVSGDFYWSAEHNGVKLIVCADCTGHGVPGGFMSMISHILLREAIDADSLDNPALILDHMNESIKEVLHQTDDINSSRDGLDIAIVVIDGEKLRFAGAMRPLYLYRSGVCNIIRGDRYSIGGIIKNKVFETKEMDVKSGDKLYLFSDGYADQFGGPNKRKMKIIVLRELLDQVSQLDIHAQQKSIADFFNSWKGDSTQMDDVLLMGVEIE